ncbi:SGNH/GDSL hydrolase family protein [Flavobacterium sp. Fl-318]|uniref:SGNH/GDSL hydrolase family protein n=1 Tax=Flavobacterium cupriresistens TaxID=2893885 RepID=A0ABU4RH28_9FLAO|nr:MULTISPECIES: SGNH/GDSL hydrolase family protein [unclassified Flavobacterium]MDX6191019.1 SGNH/GDSL hydrolase family protein [Flavobacterium sp. Fl-318]UFH43809.1 SGNH/GDSL hydrolase family protein [Flavobacterium sp. F-323]
MTTAFKQIVIVFLSIFLISCSSDEGATENTIVPPTKPVPNAIKYLALGDSYTIGQSVCETCNFPTQLQATLRAIYPQSSTALKIIATTGWTTSNLLSAINVENPEPNYDFVTLLIGVNNQYQGKSFSIYEKEFPELVTKAITLAKGDKKNVIVISIPDYAYTRFGQIQMGGQGEIISSEIDQYNNFAENYCKNNDIVFVSITDITRQGLQNTSLVASDGLHPSESAYKLFNERILPKIIITLQD